MGTDKSLSLWNVVEVAEYMHVKVRTVNRYVRQGQIPYVRRVGQDVQFVPKEIMDWLCDDEVRHKIEMEK